MAQIYYMQSNFTSGVWSPRLNARVDQEKYPNAMSEGLNVMIHPHGGVGSRTGFEHVVEGKEAGAKVRVIPFQFNVEQAYMLAFGYDSTGGYMRVMKDGGYVAVDGDDLIANGEFTTDTSHWTAENSASLSSVASGVSGNALQIAENGADEPGASQDVSVEPESLYRLDMRAKADTEEEFRVVFWDETTGVEIMTSDWTLASADWCDEHSFQTYTPFGCRTMSVTIETRAAHGDGTSMLFDQVELFRADVPYEIETPYDDEEKLFLIDWAQSADTMYFACRGVPPRKLSRLDHDDWTIEKHNTDGPYDESAEYTGTLTLSATTGTGITITASEAETFSDTDVDRIVTIKHSTTWGVARITAVTSGTVVTADVFQDFGGTAASSDWKLGIWNNETGWPEKVTFHENRLFYGRQEFDPQHMRWSNSALYDKFTQSDPLVDDDSCAYTVAGNEVNAIQWVMSSVDFLVGTTGGEWLVKGGSNNILTPTDILGRKQTGRGGINLKALYIGSAIVFVQRGGEVVRELAYSLDVDKYSDRNLSILAEHLTRDHTITDWDYQQSPDSIVWCVLEDGTMVTMTYMTEHEVLAWAEQQTQGTVHSIAVIPGEDDEVWVSVIRERKYPGWSIEVASAGGLAHSDHGTGYAGDTFELSSGGNFSTGFVVKAKDQEGEDAYFLYSGSVELGAPSAAKTVTFAAAPSGDQIEPVWDGTGSLNANWTQLDSDTHEFTSIEVLSPRFSLGDAETDDEKIALLKDAFYLDCGLTYDGTATSTLSNLGYLEGRAVQVLADGALDLDDLVVENGRLTLQSESSTVHVGLGFDVNIETMDLNANTQNGTIQTRTKKIEKVTVRCFESSAFQCGPPDGTLVTSTLRDDTTPGGEPLPPVTDDIVIDAEWDSSDKAKVRIEQPEPLPLTVLGIVLKMTLTED